MAGHFLRLSCAHSRAKTPTARGRLWTTYLASDGPWGGSHYFQEGTVTFSCLIWKLLWKEAFCEPEQKHWGMLSSEFFHMLPFYFVWFPTFLAKTFPLTVFLLETDRATLTLFSWVDTGLFKTQSWNISKALVSFQDKQGRGGCALPSATLFVPGRFVPASRRFVLNLRLLGMKSVAKSDKIF